MTSNDTAKPLRALKKLLAPCDPTATLNLMVAPPSLRGLKLVAENLLLGGPEVRHYWEWALGPLKKSVIRCLIRISRLRIDNSTDDALKPMHLRVAPVLRNGVLRPGNVMMRHGVSEFPAYAACCVEPSSETMRRRHAQLQAILIAGQARLQIQHHGEQMLSDIPFLAPSFIPDEAGRVVRLLAEPRYQHHLESLDFRADHIELCKALESVLRHAEDGEADDDAESRRLHPLALFLQKAYAGRPHIRRTGGTRSAAGGGAQIDGETQAIDKLVACFLATNSPPKAKPPSEATVDVPATPRIAPNASESKGPTRPPSSERREEIFEVSFYVTDDRAEFLKSARASAHGLAGREETRAQWLSSEWNVLTALEVDWIVHKSVEAMRRAASRGDAPDSDLIRAADSQCTITSLLTARSFAESARVKNGPGPKVPVKEGEMALTRDRNGDFWWKFPALRPAHRPVAQEHQHCVYPDATHVMLPVTKEIGEVLFSYLNLHGAFAQRLRSPDFALWFAEIDPTGRIQEPMITGFLPQRMLQGGMDIASAAAIFGLKDIGEGSRAHYYSLPLSKARQMYREALLKALPSLAPASKEINEVPTSEASLWIGAGAQLRRDKIKECLAQLRNEATAEHINTPELVSRKHNALIAYTCLGLLLACSGRVRDFLLERYSFSRDASLAILDDKIAPDKATARLLAVPECVKRQLRTSTHHCMIARAIFRPVDGEIQGELYFATDDLSTVPVTAASLQSTVDEFCPMPITAIRRYACSALIAVGVSPEAVDFTSGHLTFGQEPHRRTSTLEYNAQRKQICAAITDLLKTLAYVPLRSWLARK